MKKPRPRLRSRLTHPLMGMARSIGANENWGEPILLPQDEVAHRLSIGRTTLWRLIRAGELETVSIGSRTFVVTASLDEFVQRTTKKGHR